ncbi:MAG: GNAT family N-acetyltransferase [Putridiphycobacter sp.]
MEGNLENILEVREIDVEDIHLICDYWLNSDPEYLVGMGVDLNKLPSRVDLEKILSTQINTPLRLKKSYALIWLMDGHPIGHCNVNNIQFGKEATMHLHLWKSNHRNKGIGTRLLKLSIPLFFEKLNLIKLICEPYAINKAPNQTLKKIGFTLVKSYLTTPGSLNFEQEVNRWELTVDNLN